MPVRVPDVLIRVGGRTLQRYGVLACAGAGRTEIAYTFARADATTCATLFGSDGLIRTALANVPRIEWVDLDGDGIRESPGLLLEGSRTNVVLHNRDLTNAAWVKTGGGGVTAAKDQTGIDGVANSASRITATGANGTCLQSITLASSQRLQSCFIKRLVGTGNIDMTTDNGSTWTTLTVTSAWTRVKIPAQTLANPIVGFRIVTNADSVAIDYVQNETGAFESSPIAVTTTAVTRAADAPGILLNHGPMACSLYPEYVDRGPRFSASGNATAHIVSLGSGQPRLLIDGGDLGITAYHQPSASVNSLASGQAAFGDRVQALAVLSSNGAVRAHRRFNGGAVVSGSQSSALAFAAKWNTQDLVIFGLNHILLLDLKLFRGEFTLPEVEVVA